jgi:hypothetical protein
MTLPITELKHELFDTPGFSDKCLSAFSTMNSAAIVFGMSIAGWIATLALPGGLTCAIAKMAFGLHVVHTGEFVKQFSTRFASHLYGMLLLSPGLKARP